MIAAMQGKKTYVLLAIGALTILANKFLGIEIPGVDINPDNWMQDLFALGVGGTIRNGIK